MRQGKATRPAVTLPQLLAACSCPHTNGERRRRAEEITLGGDVYVIAAWTGRDGDSSSLASNDSNSDSPAHLLLPLHALNTTWSAAEQPATWTWVRIQRGSSKSGTWVHHPKVSEVHGKMNDWETSFDPHNGFSAHLTAAANTSRQHLSAAEANWWQKPPQYSSLAKSYKRKLMKPFVAHNASKAKTLFFSVLHKTEKWKQ